MLLALKKLFKKKENLPKEKLVNSKWWNKQFEHHMKVFGKQNNY
jgi:hypothetical protein